MRPLTERRQAVLDRVQAGATLREAATAEGVGKSTAQRWAAATSASASAVGGIENEAPATKGGAYSPGTPATAALPKPTGTPQADPSIQTTGEYRHQDGSPQPMESVVAARMNDPIYLRALHRYLGLVATGTRPHIALEGAKMVDPYFMLATGEDAALREAVQRFTGAETGTAVFAEMAPLWVSHVARDYQFDSAGRNDLLDALTDVRTDGWLSGINAHLEALGRPPLTDITDPGLLREIQLDTADRVNQVADTWNTDAAAATWRAWGDVQANGGDESDLRAAMDEWRDARAEWKGEQWSSDAAAEGIFDATKRFQDENNTAEVGWVDPPEACCDACQDAVDLGDETDPVDADVLYGLNLPLHSGCQHSVVVVMHDVSADQSLWGEDLGPSGGDGEEGA